HALTGLASIPAYPHSGGVGGVGDGGSLLYVGFWMPNQKDYIYALSGNQAYPEPIPDNRTYRYTISTNSWERLADLPFGIGYYVGCRLGYADGHIYAWQGAPSTWAGGGDDLAKYKLPIADSTPPTTTHDYDGLWHTLDFTITLTATDDISGVAETYYKINDGPTKMVSVDGQPRITVEGANNTLEYWSVDNAGNEEIPHKILTGIKLDKTAPLIMEIKRIPEGDVQPGQAVKVLANATDSLSGVRDVMLQYCIGDSPIWTNASMAFNATSSLYEGIIQGHQANTLVKYKITAYDKAGNHKVEDNNGQYYVYTVIPEYPSTMILQLLMLITLTATVLLKKKRNNIENG
ncbi:hypothetical protein KEJ32_05405, partial [Candidatus Bathyarchaeota archaeon]|nr:hypothetical protein [Candidatus Bathyarchaeota archaeon]